MSLGRPTLYKEEYCSQIIEYFSVKPYEIVAGKKEANDPPSLAGFAIKIGVCRDTINEWTRVYPDFSDAVKRAKAYQENYYLVNGNKNLINTYFAQFCMKNLEPENYKEKQEIEHSGEVTKKVQVTKIDLDERVGQLKDELDEKI